MPLISALRHALPLPFASASEPPGTGRLREPAKWDGACVDQWKDSLQESDAVCAEMTTARRELLREPATQLLVASAAPDRPLPCKYRVAVSHPALTNAMGQLHASWLSKEAASGGRSLVMASPRVEDSIAWAAACAQHRVSAVVDLGGPDEARLLKHCMRSTAPIILKHQSVAFKAENATGPTLHVEEKPMPALGPGAALREVKMVMQPHFKGAGGQAAPADAAAAEGGKDGDLKTIEQRMGWLRVPTAPGRAIAPGALLQTCRHLRGLQLQGEQTVAFMSPQGDRRSAVFGAAWEIQRRIDQGAGAEVPLTKLVEAVCTQVRAHRDPTAFESKEDVASLLAFASLAMKERQSA